jgi:diguanylate cyclase (GGDEF)-like protein
MLDAINQLLTQNSLSCKRGRILIVDDQPTNIHIMHQIFCNEHDVFMATSGEKAIEFCMKSPPDLILMDVVMPGIGGLQACRQLKQHELTASIPIIFVTAHDDIKDENACWDAGGTDFVNKPINTTTLLNRVRVHLQLKFQTDLLKDIALKDGLTGIANRRHFDEFLVREWKLTRRSDRCLGLAMIDIDFFKPFNDVYGHQAGDDCLRQVARALAKAVNRPTDFVARYGGEEFACILPETNEEGALQVGQNLLGAVSELAIPHRASKVSDCVTVSIGLHVYQGSHTQQEASLSSFVKQADTCLYQAKKAGRNQMKFC